VFKGFTREIRHWVGGVQLAAMDDQTEALAHFMAITSADDAKARQMLVAADWNVETAVGLYYASGHDEPAGGSHPAGNSHAAAMEEDVRAPIPAKVERLYGDHMPQDRMQNMGLPHGLQFGLRGVQRAAPPVDVFQNKDKKEEASTSGLSSLFKAPPYTFSAGNFDMAKAYAMEEGKWLMLNIQHPHEFRWVAHGIVAHGCILDMMRHEAFWDVTHAARVNCALHTDPLCLCPSEPIPQLAPAEQRHVVT
jgi:hypothetical protein